MKGREDHDTDTGCGLMTRALSQEGIPLGERPAVFWETCCAFCLRDRSGLGPLFLGAKQSSPPYVLPTRGSSVFLGLLKENLS